MSIPIHTLNLYQKPALGNRYINRFRAYGYQHSIHAIGGFDTASFDIAIRSRDEGQQFLDQYLGNRVAIYVDNPAEPIWEGFINRMSFSSGGVNYTISLDQMANRVKVIYTPTAGGTTQTAAATATLKSTLSQSLYGIKQEEVDMGVMLGGTGVTILRDTVLAQRALPKSSILPGSSGESLLRIECLGFYHTLTWEDYRDAATGAIALGVLVDTVIGGLANGATFFDNTDLTRTIANANTIDRFQTRGETAWDVLNKVREIANGSVYYVIGVSPTDFQTGTRRFYYEQASSAIVYTARTADGLRIRNLYGQLVPPWTVKPNAGVRVSDQLIGWNGIGDNPTETYIMRIDYDAEAQTAIYSGDDDLRAEAVFNLKQYNKGRANKPKQFGAARRLA